MTSKIEDKRKELENISDLPFTDMKLEYFNLGIELAQKEFLDFLRSLPNDCHPFKMGNECVICSKILELKQSLGEKT